MENSLDGSDRKSASGCLVYSVSRFLCHIHCGKGCVVTEGEPVGVSGLPMLQPRVLFCVPIEELYLKPGVVDEKDICCSHPEIRAEKNLPQDLVAAPEFRDHHLDLASEGLAFYLCAVKSDLFTDGIPDEHIVPEIMDVESTVKFPGMSATSLPWSGVEVLQDSVITQSAHHTEPESGCSRKEIAAGEQAVTDKNVRYAEELFPMVIYRPEAFCRLIVALVLHVFEIERYAAFRDERYGLYGEKKSRIADTGGDLRETENLKTSLCRIGSH